MIGREEPTLDSVGALASGGRGDWQVWLLTIHPHHLHEETETHMQIDTWALTQDICIYMHISKRAHAYTHTPVLHCIGLNCVPHSNSCVKILTPNVALFGPRTSREVIKVK